MVKLRSILFIFGLLIFLVACQSQPTVSELPTLVDFPTETASFTPSPSSTATSTPNITSTPTRPTATPTIRLSPTASFTPTLVWTRAPSATPTSTVTATPSLPPASPTPIATRTPDVPTIDLFQANSVNVSASQPIQLRWIASADSLILETVSNNIVTQSQAVNMTGTYSTNAPSTNGQIVYRLVASRGGTEVRSTVTINVGPTCTINWFFNNAPTTIGCPAAAQVSAPILFQQFQQGFMFRTIVNGNNRVCGVQTVENVYSCYVPQVYSGTPPVTPPSGFQVPAPELAYSFYNDLATGGFWYEKIGWGTAAATNVNGQTQAGADGRLYIQLPTGVYSFDASLSSFGAPLQRVSTP